MIFKCVRNEQDPIMVEFYYTYNGNTYLACVMNEDCLSDGMDNILNDLDSVEGIEVELIRRG